MCETGLRSGREGGVEAWSPCGAPHTPPRPCGVAGGAHPLNSPGSWLWNQCSGGDNFPCAGTAPRRGDGVPSVTQNTLELAWGPLCLTPPQVSSVLLITMHLPPGAPRAAPGPPPPGGSRQTEGGWLSRNPPFSDRVRGLDKESGPTGTRADRPRRFANLPYLRGARRAMPCPGREPAAPSRAWPSAVCSSPCAQSPPCPRAPAASGPERWECRGRRAWRNLGSPVGEAPGRRSSRPRATGST